MPLGFEIGQLEFLAGFCAVADLVARKLAGAEQSTLKDADIAFHEAEYQRLRAELQVAHEASRLPEAPDE